MVGDVLLVLEQILAVALLWAALPMLKRDFADLEPRTTRRIGETTPALVPLGPDRD